MIKTLPELNQVQINMKNALQHTKSAELYYCQRIKDFFQINNIKQNYSNNISVGISGRVFNSNMVGFAYYPGITEQDMHFVLKEADENLNRTPLTGFMPLNGKHDFPIVSHQEDGYIKDFFTKKLFESMNEIVNKEGLVLENLYCHSDKMQYILANTNLISGGGSYKFCAFGFDFFIKKNSKRFVITIICKPDELDIMQIVNEAIYTVENKSANLLRRKLSSCPILLTHNAVSLLVSVFLSFLTSESIFHKRSFIREKKNRLYFGSKLSIIENYNGNKNFIANIDCEGTERFETIIIDKGELRNIISDIRYGNEVGVPTTASSWRDSYKSMPTVKAISISVGNGNYSTDQIIEKNEQIIVIDDLMGLAPGLNPSTGDFQVTSDGYLFYNGKSEGQYRFLIQSNLITLFNSIVETSIDRKYGFDGTVYVPSFLIENIGISILN